MNELLTLRSLVDGLSEHGDRPAVLALRKQEMERWSYAKLADQVQRLAQGLAKAGVGKGVPVALFATNRPEWLVACLAVIKAGAVAVPVDVQLGDDVLTHVLNDSGSRFLCTTSDQLERLDRLELKASPQRILLDAGTDEEQSWQRLLSDQSAELPQVEPDDPAVLFYTSGTTGMPKGVPLSHRNLVFQLNTLRQANLVREDDRFLLPLPLHHVYPFVLGMLGPMLLGLPLVLPQALTGPQMIRALQEGEVTAIIGVPRLYRALYEGIERRLASRGLISRLLLRATIGLSTWLRRRVGLRLGKLLLRPLHKQLGPTLRILVSGGAALDPDLAWKLEGLGWKTASGYGLTETAPMLTLDPPGRARIGSVGRPLAGVEIRIDRSARPDQPPSAEAPAAAQANEEGEILARGPGVFAGYHNLPDKTAEAFTRDGWFRTGDLGYLDADGYLYVTGRVKTLIVAEGGEKAQPDQVEEAYQEHPALREVGVLQKDGRLVAVIVPGSSAGRGDQDGELDRAIRAAIDEQSKKLPSYQRVSDYVLSRQPLPRTQLGKIQRHKLEERYEQVKKGAEKAGEKAVGPMSAEEMNPEDRALLENPAAQQVWEWLADRYREQPLTPDTSPQHDLGVDSMEWLNLTLEIRQHAGVELSEEAIGELDTVRGLLQAVAEASEGEGTGAKMADLDRPEEALSEEQKGRLEPPGLVRSGIDAGLYQANRMLMRALFRLQVRGAGHLPSRGPFVLASNHSSHLDSLAIAAALDYRRYRDTFWVALVGADVNAILSGLVRLLPRALPIDPRRGVLSSLALAAAALKRSRSLVWYPEGQRSVKGELQSFKPGLGVLTEHVPATIVPVFVHGTHDALPPGSFLPRLNQVTVVFGPALDPRELERQGDGEKPADRMVQALYDRVAELRSS
jgi:long-chain acyl-CoA synthetase